MPKTKKRTLRTKRRSRKPARSHRKRRGGMFTTAGKSIGKGAAHVVGEVLDGSAKKTLGNALNGNYSLTPMKPPKIPPPSTSTNLKKTPVYKPNNENKENITKTNKMVQNEINRSLNDL